MPRHILIDTHSGFIFGDSADIDGQIVNGSPFEVVMALHRSMGIDTDLHTYTEQPASAGRGTGASGFLVYRADVNGSEAVPVVHDGQDQDTIDAVTRTCTLECFVEVTRHTLAPYADMSAG